MQQVRIIHNMFFCLLALSTLVSCGNVDSTYDTAGGGIGGTGISFGKITGFGSVFVNGIEFETQGATIKKDGVDVAVVTDQEDREHLRVGMIVTVRATFNPGGTTGSATSIEFRDNLEGPIASVNTVNKTFEVLGQTIIVDAATVLEDQIRSSVRITGEVTILNTLEAATGNIVEVSGLVDADGTIRASYIELKDYTFTEGIEIEIKGIIKALDANTFMIGSLTVDYMSLPAIIEIPGGIREDIFVEVKSTKGFDPSGALIASRVELEDSESGHKEGDESEIEGYVTSFISASDFKVSGYPVAVTSNTRYENGTVADIKLNARIEAEGTINAEGVLIAREISFESESGEDSSHSEGEAEIEGHVNKFTSASDFEVNGYPVAVTAETKYEHGTESDIMLNARLQAKGTINAEGVLEAREISFKNRSEGDDNDNDSDGDSDHEESDDHS